MASHGASSDLSYNIALCHFRQKQYAAALKLAADIIAQGVREHPELGVGSTTGGVSVRSVGNSQLLRSTALIEAFNLKVCACVLCSSTACTPHHISGGRVGYCINERTSNCLKSGNHRLRLSLHWATLQQQGRRSQICPPAKRTSSTRCATQCCLSQT